MKEIRTSASHPLEIFSIPANKIGGTIGLCMCPGKTYESSEFQGFWDRNLEQDLDILAKWGPKVAITLMEKDEMERVEASSLGCRFRELGFTWIWLPIVDRKPPGLSFESRWMSEMTQLLEVLNQGHKILIHCRGGLGRSGTVAARLLIDYGFSPTDAINKVRCARPGAIETSEQEKYLSQLA